MKRVRLAPAAALLALSPLLLTACGSADSSSSSGSSGSGNAGRQQGCRTPTGMPTDGAGGRRPSGAPSGVPSGAPGGRGGQGGQGGPGGPGGGQGGGCGAPAGALQG
ncbi:hypothetical protein ACFY71_21970 [Streptomyces cinerochromogenes]|uniref:hypothetical protein n=1 Tax=Streptomyces cinerochromogenes TaxID=66422 RepID=UPI003684CCB5